MATEKLLLLLRHGSILHTRLSLWSQDKFQNKIEKRLGRTLISRGEPFMGGDHHKVGMSYLRIHPIRTHSTRTRSALIRLETNLILEAVTLMLAWIQSRLVTWSLPSGRTFLLSPQLRIESGPHREDLVKSRKQAIPQQQMRRFLRYLLHSREKPLRLNILKEAIKTKVRTH